MRTTRITKKHKKKAIHRWLRYFVPMCIVTVVIVFGIISWMASAASPLSKYEVHAQAPISPTNDPLPVVDELPSLMAIDPLRPDSFNSRDLDKIVKSSIPSAVANAIVMTTGLQAVAERLAILSHYRNQTIDAPLRSQEKNPLLMSLGANIDSLVDVRKRLTKETKAQRNLNLVKSIYTDHHTYSIVVPRLQGQVVGLIGQRICNKLSGYGLSMSNTGNRDLYSLTLDEVKKFYDLGTQIRNTCTTYSSAVIQFKHLKNSDYPADKLINTQIKAVAKANDLLTKQRSELADVVTKVDARRARDMKGPSVIKVFIITPRVNISAGETLQMTAQFVMDNDMAQTENDCTWSLEGDQIGTINNQGLLTTTDTGGQATVRVSCKDKDQTYNASEMITAMTLEVNPNATEPIIW